MSSRQRDSSDFLGAGDPGTLDTLYRRYLHDRHAVAPDLAGWFARAVDDGPPHRELLAAAYRRYGYLAANLDPLGLHRAADPPELDPVAYGLAELDAAPLRAAYCGPIGWDFDHIHDHERRAWMRQRAEEPYAAEDDEAVLDFLCRVEAFEQFLAERLPTTKRFGSEGAETFILLMERVIRESAAVGIEDVTIGGMHRGRIAQLALVAGKPLHDLMAELRGEPAVPAGLDVASDVAYHLGYSGDRHIDGRPIHISVGPHPSHLEIIGAVTAGRARAKQRRGSDVLPLVVHTDASFAGQGIVAETFQMARLPAFAVGGTIHLVLNNQLGFTTSPAEGRSSRYCTDVAHITEVPVLHVNGDEPDAVVRAAVVAARWRATFASDIVIDLWCYRRNGHNEIDEPRFTQPEMYGAIDRHPGVATRYARRLGREKPRMVGYRKRLAAAFEAVRGEPPPPDWFGGAWRGLRAGAERELTTFVPTGLPIADVRAAGEVLTTPPSRFRLEPKVARFLDQRRASLESGDGINWATAEALALATLLRDGWGVRLGGQDTPRGAFTQRHLFLVDQESGASHGVLGPDAEVFNSPLTEYAVLAFEYGHSLADPRTLVLWEAQFGDFLNIAQAVFDQFIACGEDRWQRSTGIVLLLPHGLDGGGPDHSTARPERLLAACAGGNLQVANPSTPANYFHLLRRQMHRPFRKPLAVLAPKALLRLRKAVSPVTEFGPGTGFRSVLPDPDVSAPSRTILCSGKIYYELAAAREALGASDVAIVRVEQLWPFPEDEVRVLLTGLRGTKVVWCQEEPWNMGPFVMLKDLIERAAGRTVAFVGRPAAASPAAGNSARHEAERRQLLDRAFTI